MKRAFLAILIGLLSAPAAPAQSYGLANGCVTGQCPIVGGPPPVVFAPPRAPVVTIPAGARAAIVRIVNAQGASRAMGTGTLVDADGSDGLVITCAHLFREGSSAIQVTYPGGRSYAARLVKIDGSADLAALSTRSAGVEPIVVAEHYPQRGDPLVSCGYGSDGRLWCNRGEALGYVTTSGSHGTETLELSGAARFGDSGGPVFNRNYELVAVLFGTNGRVVDGTFCGRVRRFLHGLSPRFGRRQQADPQQPPSPDGGIAKPDAPLVDVPPAPTAPAKPPAIAQPAGDKRLSKLEGLVARLHERWRGLSTKIDHLAEAIRNMRGALPVHAEVAPPAQSNADPLDPIAETARPWLSARLAAILVSFGVPGGIAGVVAGATVYLLMRRGKRRLQARLDRLKTGLADASEPSAEGDGAADEPIVRHHNQYVPYEVTALDRAWSSAHAHIGEKYPGAVPYLKMVEGVKDQLLSGNEEPTIPEGRLS